MRVKTSVVALGAFAASAAAFTPATPAFTNSRVALKSSLSGGFELADIEKEVRRIFEVKPYPVISAI